jgi:hypothetical protein
MPAGKWVEAILEMREIGELAAALLSEQTAICFGCQTAT